MKLTPMQKAALELLDKALVDGTECSLFDEMTRFCHPDIINTFADSVTQMKEDVDADDK